MKKIIPIILISLVFLQCREDIVHPGNAAGVINEPIIEKTKNSYTFLINAQNFTINLSDFVTFQNTKTSLLLDINDYSAGISTVNLYSQSNIIFSKVAENNVDNLFERIDGSIPSSLNLSFENFTGKLRFELVSQ